MWFSAGILFALVVVVYYRRQISKEYTKLRYYLKIFFYYFLYMVVSFLISPFIIIKRRHHSNGILVGNWLSYVISNIFGIEWRLRNGAIIAENRGAVLVSNHQLGLDLLGAFEMFKVLGKVVLVAKKSLLYTPSFGLVAYLSGTVFIDRDDPRQAFNKLKEAMELVTKDKVKIWIFPEGTRNESKIHKMLPFKAGAFKVAVLAQVPIIPVVFSPYNFVDKDNYIFDKGYVIMQCLEPIPTVGLTMEDVPALINHVRNIMLNTYEELSKEVTSTLNE